MKVLAILLLVAAASAIQIFDAGYENGNVDSWVMRDLKDYGTADIMVKLWGDFDPEMHVRDIKDKSARRQAVHDLLRSFSEKAQASLVSFLQSRGIAFTPFWIVNAVLIRNADAMLIKQIAARDDVEVIRGDRIIPLHSEVENIPNAPKTDAVEWNIQIINANAAWALGYKGANVVVANIDTGVRYTHEALNANWRGTSTGSADYNWFDPRGTYTVPTDTNGHGSHTMGTICGAESIGIGVAPSAKWIAAKGCALVACSSADLTASAQWMVAPTKIGGGTGDATKAPDVISNSWGGNSGDTWYQSYLKAWRAAKIYPVFSAGNSGPNCETVNSPGDNAETISVAASDSSDVLASFSSKGPGSLVTQKPQITAPGVNVRSSYSSSDTSYSSLSGTSMACPHISGVAALVLSANSALTPDQMDALMIASVKTGLGNPGTPLTCGGVSYTTYPNYHYGYGRIDALVAVNAALNK